MPPRNPSPVSPECRRQLAAWLRECCPCAMDDPDRVLYLGVLAICATEVERRLAAERDRVTRMVRRPCRQ